MAEKKPNGKAMAQALRGKGRSGPEHDLARIGELHYGPPSAEYVARVNRAQGNVGAGPATVAMMLEEEREIPGPYGRMPLARRASGRLPVAPAAPSQPNPFTGARAAGSATLDPRVLALALRAGR